MKLTSAVSVIVLLLPVLAQAAVVPRDPSGALVARQRGGRDRERKAAEEKAKADKAAADKAKAEADKAKTNNNNNNNNNGGNQNGGNQNGGNQNAGNQNGGNQNGGNQNGGNQNGGNQNGGNQNGGNQNGGNNGGNNNNNGDPQKSLTLDPAVIQSGLAQSGQNGTPEPGQVASLTSSNNFINFCLTTGLPLTNGKQIQEGSCNPTPMGAIVAQTKMPSAKFISPKNGDTVTANTEFDIKLAVKNMQTGNFVNPNTNYFAAPAQVNQQGIIIAHSHVVIQKLPSLDTTQVPDPTVFAFFKGLNNADQGGVLTTTVTSPTTKGLLPGDYRLCSINTAANHQPILVAVAQHGSLDDCVYFTAK